MASVLLHRPRVASVPAIAPTRFERFVKLTPVIPILPALVFGLSAGSSAATVLLGFLVAFGVGIAVEVVVLLVAVIVLGAPLVRDAIRTRSERSLTS